MLGVVGVVGVMKMVRVVEVVVWSCNDPLVDFHCFVAVKTGWKEGYRRYSERTLQTSKPSILEYGSFPIHASHVARYHQTETTGVMGISVVQVQRVALLRAMTVH